MGNACIDKKFEPRTTIRTTRDVVCGETSCVWNDVYRVNQHKNGCAMLTDIKICRGVCTVDEAEKKGLILPSDAESIRKLQGMIRC